MKIEIIIERLYKYIGDNHFFFSKNNNFYNELCEHNEKVVNIGLSYHQLHVRSIYLGDSKCTQDVLDALKKSILTSKQANEHNTEESVLMMAETLSEPCIKTHFLLLNGLESFFSFNSSNALKILKNISAISGTRFIIFGNIKLYEYVQKNKSFFVAPFIRNNIDATSYKRHTPFLCNNHMPTNIELLGGADAIVERKRGKSNHGKTINVLPYSSPIGDYISIDKKSGISYWKTSDILFCKEYTKGELIETIKKELIESSESSKKSVFVTCSDGTKVEFYSGFVNDGSCFCSFKGKSSRLPAEVKDISAFVNREIDSVFSISILQDSTHINYQSSCREIAPLVRIPTPQEDILYHFIVLYHVDGVNVIYMEDETILKHDLDSENTTIDEVKERILSDLSCGVIYFDGNTPIKENRLSGLIYKKKIERLHTISPVEKYESYIQEYQNICYDIESDEWAITHELKTLVADDILFERLAELLPSRTKDAINELPIIPFAFHIAEEKVKTKDIVSSTTSVCVTEER